MPFAGNSANLIGDALKLLADGLGPFVIGKIGKAARQRRFALSNDDFAAITAGDVAIMLRVINDACNDVFSNSLSRNGRTLVFEVRDIRNSWAHMTRFSEDDLDRALDSIERLLGAIGAADNARQVSQMKKNLRRARYATPPQMPATPIPTAPPPKPEPGPQKERLQPLVRGLMQTLLDDYPTLLDDSEANNLTNPDYCKRHLGLKIGNFALLRNAADGRMVNGHGRYWKELYAGRFYVCSQWWKDHHKHNADVLRRFITELSQNQPNHPGVPALERHREMLTDYIRRQIG